MIGINKIKLVLPCLLLLFFAGCYEEKVMEATSKLKIGMSKSELDQLFKEVIHRMWITSFHLFLGLFLISYQQKQAIPT